MTHALHAEAYTNLESLEISSHYHEGLQAISDLPDPSNHVDFDTWSRVNNDDYRNIYNAVSYLNFIVHLIHEDYLDYEQAKRLYFTAYKLCYDKLFDKSEKWWLDGIRKSRDHAFTFFECMCVAIVGGRPLDVVLQETINDRKLTDQVQLYKKKRMQSWFF